MRTVVQRLTIQYFKMIKKELVLPGMEYSRSGYSSHRRVVRLKHLPNGDTEVYYREVDPNGVITERSCINHLSDFTYSGGGFELIKAASNSNHYSVF